jgi:hypothetical protein
MKRIFLDEGINNYTMGNLKRKILEQKICRTNFLEQENKNKSMKTRKEKTEKEITK